ncbi:MAG: hypothetical protein ACI9QL_000516 [Candidatus Omnitrophota bacterium]|jgi:hypothetical protein
MKHLHLLTGLLLALGLSACSTPEPKPPRPITPAERPVGLSDSAMEQDLNKVSMEDEWKELPADDQKLRELARQYLVLTGTDLSMAQVVKDIITPYRDELKQVPKIWWEEEFMPKIDVKEVQEAYIDTVLEEFTQGELEELVQFFKTPAGRKYVARFQSIDQNRMVQGMEWARKLRKLLTKELTRQGFMFGR